MLSQDQNKWKMIEFSELGFIGKLFRCSDLPMFMHMFLLYSFNKPIDLIHNIVFDALVCDPAKSQVLYLTYYLSI
jgi:alpha-1,3-mannosylglycoprotein beta-1,4-N-acetylglucosaminyltransferase A/B